MNVTSFAANASARAPIEHNHYVLLFAVVPIAAAFGNALVILAVGKERNLQTVTNYLVVSLAVSDFLVAALVMSFGVYVGWNSFVWDLGPRLCNIYIGADVICSTASILNLFVISLDRYIAISHPLAYARFGGKGGRSVFSIVVVWTISLAVGIPVLFGANQLDDDLQDCGFTNPYFIMVSSLLSFFLPCLAMIVLYAIILHRLKLRERARSRRSERSTRRPQNMHIAQALLGGAYLARQMQVILENSLQTSSYPSDSSSEDESTSSPTGSTSSNYARHEVRKISNAIIKQSHSFSRKESTRQSLKLNYGTNHSVIPEETIIVNTFSGSFGERLDELFPYIDSCSRQNSTKFHNGTSFRRVGVIQNNDATSLQLEKLPESPLEHKVATEAKTTTFANGHTSPEVEQNPITKKEVEGGESYPFNRLRHSCQSARTRFLMGLFNKDIKPLVADTNNNEETVLTVLPAESCTTKTKLLELEKERPWKRFFAALNPRPTKHLVKKATRHMKREQKATITLAVVLGAFLGCWVPFFTLHFLNGLCLLDVGEQCVPGFTMFLVTWFGYLNSSLNPLIYTVFDPRFRKAFRNVLKC